jgi:hypothetical protein
VQQRPSRLACCLLRPAAEGSCNHRVEPHTNAEWHLVLHMATRADLCLGLEAVTAQGDVLG